MIGKVFLEGKSDIVLMNSRTTLIYVVDQNNASQKIFCEILFYFFHFEGIFVKDYTAWTVTSIYERLKLKCKY